MRKLVLLFVSLMVLVTGCAQADTMPSNGNGLITKASAHSVDVTAKRLKNVLQKKGIKVMAEVDHQKNATGAGLELKPTRLVIFGNPKLGTPLMHSNRTAGIDLPMKALIWEDGNGKVWLAYNDPKYLSKRHTIGDRQAVVDKMTGALDKMTQVAVSVDP